MNFRIDDEKTNNLIHDALHNNLTHLEKCDIDDCFDGEYPKYFEADTIDKIVNYAKSANGKIKAMLLFARSDTTISEVQETIDALEPYCTKDCINNGKILVGCSLESDSQKSEEMKYRMLILVEK